MKKIIDYAIVTDTSHEKVAHDVNELLKQGFQPLGGVCVGPDGGLYQAMGRSSTELFEASSVAPALTIKP